MGWTNKCREWQVALSYKRGSWEVRGPEVGQEKQQKADDLGLDMREQGKDSSLGLDKAEQGR